MLSDSHAAFPNRIRALVVESDARFLSSACLMLSLLNFRVATCETPALAVKLLNGRLKEADVVFIDALRAALCGFDFREMAERHLLTPVVYFFSFDYKVAGDAAEALRRTVWAATYVVKKPLDAGELSRLWRIIQWSKALLRRGENTLSWLEWPRGDQPLPATVEARLLSSSTTIADQGEEEEEAEDNDCDLFKVVRAGRGRERNLGDSHDGGSSGHGRGGGAGSFEIGGRPTTRRLAEQMNVTEGQESQLLQQPAQQNQRGVQVQAMDVQNQQHGRSVFMQSVLQMLNLPRNNPMVSANAAGASSSNAGASNTSAGPGLLPPLPVYRAPARATSPAQNAVYSAQAPAPGLPPPVYQQQQPVAVARAGRGRRRKLGDGHDDGASGRGRGRGGIAGGQPARSLAEQMNLTEGQESDDEDVVPSHHNQQPALQNRRRVLQAMDVPYQQHGRSLFLQPVTQMLNVPRNNPMFSTDAAGSSSSYATAFARASVISAPALLPAAYQAPARARAASAQAAAPEQPPPVYQQQQPPPVYQQQQPLALYNFGNMVAPPGLVPTMFATSGQQPQFQHQDMFAPWRHGSWMGHHHETGPIMLNFQQPPAADPLMPEGATDAGEYGNDAAMAHLLQSPSVGAQPADSFDDVLRAMLEMNDAFARSSYYANCSGKAPMAPAATDELAAMQAALLGSGKCSNNNNKAGSFMVKDVDGGNSASFMAPQDPAVAAGKNQVELGAPEIYGSLVESPGSNAMFYGNGDDMTAMFPSDQYDENAMFPLDALWNFDDNVPVHLEGQQVAAADDTTVTNAAGIKSNGGESGGLGPN